MPTVEQNFSLWNEEHDWPLSGDEWSKSWGGAQAQWHGCILPRISPFIPAANILELAPGHGRWTQFLQAYATSSLALVDLAPRCIAACRSRFSGLEHLRYHVNDGRSLDMTASLMAHFCQEAGLTCSAQEVIPWESSRRPIDCFTVFKKEKVPVSRSRQLFVNHRFMQEAANTKRLALLYGSSDASAVSTGRDLN